MWAFVNTVMKLNGQIRIFHNEEPRSLFKISNAVMVVVGERNRYSDWLPAGQSSIPGRVKNCHHFVQTGSGAYPAPYPMGTGGPSLRFMVVVARRLWWTGYGIRMRRKKCILDLDVETTCMAEKELRGQVWRILGQLRAVNEGSVKAIVVFILGFRNETLL
jgi:hypothetical protein